MNLEEKLNLLPKSIKVDDTYYCLRIIPLNEEFWEISYFKLNDNGDKDKENKLPVLKYLMDRSINDATDQMIEWAKREKYYKNE